MPDYRIYCLDIRDHIDFADWLEAESDEEAIAQARKRKLGARMCEIWREQWLIAKFDATGEVVR